MDNRIKPYIYVVFAILCWGSSAAVGKLLLNSLTPVQTMFSTAVFATATLFCIVLLQGKMKVYATYSLKDYVRIIGAGLLGFPIYIFCFYSALALMSAQETYIVNYLWPIMVVIFATIILQERFDARKLTAIALSFVGVMIVVTNGNIFSFESGNFHGILLAATGAVAYGLFSVLDKKFGYEKTTENLIFYSLNLGLSALVLGFSHTFPIWSHLSFGNIVGLFWAGAVSGVLGSLAWLSALKHGNTARISNLIFLAPFVSLVYIYFLVGERILISSVIGLLVIVAGIVLQSMKTNPLRVTWGKS